MSVLSAEALEGLNYYATVYPDYDKQSPPHKLHHYWSVIAEYQPQPLPLLDFGCAHGKFLRFAAQQVGVSDQLYGYDQNAPAVAQAQTGCEARFVSGDRLAALQSLPPMRVITALDVLEHVSDLDTALAQLHDQLMPCGLLLAVVPVYDGILGPLVHWLDKDPTHLHKYGRAFWLTQLAQYFDIEDWHGVVRYLLPTGYYLHWPNRVLRGISPAIVIACRKRA